MVKEDRKAKKTRKSRHCEDSGSDSSEVSSHRSSSRSKEKASSFKKSALRLTPLKAEKPQQRVQTIIMAERCEFYKLSSLESGDLEEKEVATNKEVVHENLARL